VKARANRHKHPCAARRGFTLIELLVVIAILTLLIAVLLPSLRKARWEAKRLLCQANLKDLAVAWEMYLQENRDRYYQWTDSHIKYGGKQGLPIAYKGRRPLNPYVDLPETTDDGAELFFCPDDRGSPGLPATSTFDYYGTSYMANRLMIGHPNLNVVPNDPCRDVMIAIRARLRDLNRSQTSDASRLILLGDFGWRGDWYFGVGMSPPWHHERGKHNIAFSDGHVAYIRIRKGLHETPYYTVVPFLDLRDDAQACQIEVAPQSGG